MVLHSIAAVALATVLAAASSGVLVAMSNADPDKTVGGAYAALATFIVAPLVFVVTLWAYAFALAMFR